MLRKFSLLLSLILLLGSLVTPAWAQDDTQAPTITDIVVDNEDFSTLEAAVQAAGLGETLSSEGPFTVFAPTNAAFEAALNQLGLTADELLADTQTLTTILQYHVVAGEVFSQDLSAGDVATLQGEPVTIALDEGVMVNNATVTIPDVDASNGVVHVIDQVLLPPSMMQDMGEDDMAMDEAETNAFVRIGHFSPDTPAVDIYVNGVVSVEALEYPNMIGLVGLASGEYEIAVAPSGTSIEEAAIGPLTLTFAANTLTTIAAVGSLEAGTLTATFTSDSIAGLPSGNAQVNVLHAIEGAPTVNVVAGDTPLVTDLAYPGELGDNDGFFILDTVPTGTYDLSIVTAADGTEILALPGTELMDNTFYLIVAIGTPDSPEVRVFSATESTLGIGPGNIVQVAESAGNFSTLLQAAQAAGLADILSNEGPFTVFAPTDDAFAAALDALGLTAEELLADTELLTTILQYHVVAGEVPASQVVGLDEANTLLGEPISIAIENDQVILNDNVTVTTPDIEASNGLIHVIDGVLLPPSMSDTSE